MTTPSDPRRTPRTRRGLAVVTLAIVVGVAVLAGCGARQATGAAANSGVIRVNSGVVASNLDPAIMNDQPSAAIVTNVYEPLLKFDAASGELVPYLAESWTTSPDATTITFALRSGVTFHDGSTLTAAGVKISMQRMMTVGKGFTYLLSGVTDIQAPSDLQLVITLKAPDVAFLGKLGQIYIPSAQAVTAHAGSDNGQQWFGSNDAGSGPYRVTSYTPNNKITLEKFDGYWRGWAGDHASGYEVTAADPATETLNIRQGTADVADSVSVQDVASLKGDDRFQVATNPGAPFYLTFNMQSPRLKNPAIRQAIALAVPYEEIISSVMLGYASRLQGPVPDWMQSADKDIPLVPTDVAKATSLMASAGYSKANPLDLSLLYYNGLPFEKTLSTAVQASLGDIGVNLSVEGAPWPTFTAKAQDATTRPDMGVLSVGASTPNAGPLLSASFDPVNQGSYKYWGYDGEATGLIRQGVAATTTEEQNQLFAQAQTSLVDDYATIWLMKYPRLIVTKSSVKNMKLDPTLAVFDFYSAYIAE